jgi:hypothetical protein
LAERQADQLNSIVSVYGHRSRKRQQGEQYLQLGLTGKKRDQLVQPAVIAVRMWGEHIGREEKGPKTPYLAGGLRKQVKYKILPDRKHAKA